VRSSFVCVLTLLICNLVDLGWRESGASSEQSIDDHAAVLAPIEVGSLALFPIVTLDDPPGDDVLSLDEAMRSRIVRIREIDGGRVDTLELSNAADQPVFVLAGEVILGGKQDRVIAANTIIPPHTTLPVAVRCVEKGRWSDTGTTEFTTASTLAHDRVRGSAVYATQADVWSEVSRANQAHGTTNETDTYRTIAARQAAEAKIFERRIDDALAALPPADRRRMIGYVVAYDGVVSAVDIFRSPSLFGKLERKLVRSYLAQTTEHTAARPPCVHAIRDFIADAKRGAPETVIEGASFTLIQRGAVASTSRVEIGDRHLYANYLGNARIHREPAGEPRGNCDRRLYPSYLGNAQTNRDCWDPPAYDRHLYPSYLGNNPRPRSDQPCERGLYPSYLGNTEAWNECRRARGLPVAGEAAPKPGRLRRTDEDRCAAWLWSTPCP
jgi:hypothetical protein